MCLLCHLLIFARSTNSYSFLCLGMLSISRFVNPSYHYDPRASPMPDFKRIPISSFGMVVGQWCFLTASGSTDSSFRFFRRPSTAGLVVSGTRVSRKLSLDCQQVDCHVCTFFSVHEEFRLYSYIDIIFFSSGQKNENCQNNNSIYIYIYI